MVSIFDKIEDQKKKRSLRAIAKTEYESSRGVQHLRMLRIADEKLAQTLKKCEKTIKSLSNDLEKMDEETQTKLRITLEKHLINTHIMEIPGIGQSLGSIILNDVYESSFDDLMFASDFEGIGEKKQRSIDRWVAKYERQVPALLKQDFPGKNAIIAESSGKISSIQSELIKWQAKKGRIEKMRETSANEIEWLKNVSLDDFVNARVNHEGDFVQIENFISGVFPEWEDMPDWFKKIIRHNEDDDV